MTAGAARELPDLCDPQLSDSDIEELLRGANITPGLYTLTRKSEDLLSLMAQYFRGINTDRMEEFRAIAEAIMIARHEIRDLRPVDMSQKQLPAAGAEMDAIILDTETATNTIMSAAERILELETTDTAAKGAIDDAVMRIFEACSFQDITGQRVSKIVRVLDQIEDRMTRLVTSLGMRDDSSDEISAEEQRRRDLILNGPAIGGPETDQAEIDSMFGPNSQDEIDALMN